MTIPHHSFSAGQTFVLLPDARAYARPESNRLLFGFRESQSVSVDPRLLPQKMDGYVFDQDPNGWESLLEGMPEFSKFVPLAEQLAISHYIRGLSNYTPDGNFVLGDLPTLDGLLVATGCAGAGLAMSGGIGRFISDLVAGRQTFVDAAPHRIDRFVLVATSPLRESLRRDDRAAFIRRCVSIATGRPLIFKLHSSEQVERAIREIQLHAPGAVVLTNGNVNHMIANASTVITQQSTCTFVAVALGKEVYTNLNLDELQRLMPIQNNGASARRIATIGKRVLQTPMPVLQQIRRRVRVRPRWEKADSI